MISPLFLVFGVCSVVHVNMFMKKMLVWHHFNQILIILRVDPINIKL